ncbi:MAG TPA: Sir2 family NAD-dependent protein deacetylase, partial [Bryobacteraceae bacterium]|nr:Sir2 family NAD-dependent protein deacetylase [Bryobacteraceae bacterium]
LRLHGSLWRIRCQTCVTEVANVEVPLVQRPPYCSCGGMMRPGVVWFGEGLNPTIWDNAQEAVRTAGVLLVIGTSAVVYPAASLVPLAKQSGATVVEINLDETPISRAVDFSFRGLSGEILPALRP